MHDRDLTGGTDAEEGTILGSVAHRKRAEIVLDTDVSGRSDDFNPAELLLSAVAACMIKGIERV